MKKKMLNSIIFLTKLTSQHANLAGFHFRQNTSRVIRNCYLCCVNSFTTSAPQLEKFRRRHVNLGREAHKEELRMELEFKSSKYVEIFPDENTATRMFDGIMYKEIPIVNIRTSKSNTIMTLTDHRGLVKLIRSCGIEGFKNTKKGTNIAAQATAVTFSRRAVDMGYKTVRVRIQGIGPGRNSSVKGLALGGLNMVSITDNTKYSENPARGKKLKRI